MWFEDLLIFRPTRFPQGDWGRAEASSPGDPMRIEDVTFAADDGVSLHGWYATPADTSRGSSAVLRPVLLYCHGNAGNVAGRYDHLQVYVALGFDVLIFDYRGFGKSSGRPTEQGVYLDAQAAWRYLTADRGISADRIVLMGKSLGGAVAIDLACHVDPAGLIVENTFTSIPDMAKVQFPFLPRWAVRSRMASIDKVGSIACPKLILHGRLDQIVPFEQGERLFRAAAEPKRFVPVADANHDNLMEIGGPGYTAEIVNMVQACLAATPSTAPG